MFRDELLAGGDGASGAFMCPLVGRRSLAETLPMMMDAS